MKKLIYHINITDTRKLNCWIERNANINIFELLSKYSYLLADYNNEKTH